jgi:hypothetical protein
MARDLSQAIDQRTVVNWSGAMMGGAGFTKTSSNIKVDGIPQFRSALQRDLASGRSIKTGQAPQVYSVAR